MFLLDTSILSELLRRVPNRGVLERLARASWDELATSTVCVMEMRHGAMLRRDGELLWARIRRHVLRRVRVIPFDGTAAEHAGDILATLDRAGRGIGIADVQIGATARSRDLVLVTANVRHFIRIERLTVEDWTR